MPAWNQTIGSRLDISASVRWVGWVAARQGAVCIPGGLTDTRKSICSTDRTDHRRRKYVANTSQQQTAVWHICDSILLNYAPAINRCDDKHLTHALAASSGRSSFLGYSKNQQQQLPDPICAALNSEKRQGRSSWLHARCLILFMFIDRPTTINSAQAAVLAQLVRGTRAAFITSRISGDASCFRTCGIVGGPGVSCRSQ